MSHPLLDQLQLHALRDKERRAGVAQVVKADVLEPVLPQDRGKTVAHVIGREQLTQRIHTNAILVLQVIRTPELFASLLLLFSFREKHYLDGRI